MKHNLLIIIILLLFHSLSGQISREQAFEIINTEVLAGNADNVNVFASKTILPPNSIINTLLDEIVSPNISAWMFFIDDYPFQNWAHPARYAFVGNTGQVIIQPYIYPPFKDNLDVLIEKTIIIPQENDLQKILTSIQKNSQDSSLREHEYAVIINGGLNIDYNFERYWNDCAAIYNALVHVYNYNKSNIYVLISDGTDPAIDRHRLNGRYDSSPLDLDGDGLPDIQYAATKANISLVFDTLSEIMTTEDNLFIYTTGHGGPNKSGKIIFLNLWNDGLISTNEFADEINKLNAQTINVVMQQCFSGAFIDDLAAENRVIATSCANGEYSWALNPYYEYNEFTYHWVSAILSQTPRGVYEHANCKYVNADCNQDCFISMQEAFTYAMAHDIYTIDPEQEMYETPQYFSQPENLGETLNMGYISTYFLTNQTMTTNKDITMCGEINIQNVTISNDATININSGDKVVINPNFHVATGTNVHITIGNPLECDALPQKSLFFTNNESHFEEPYLQNFATNITNFTNQIPNFTLYPNPSNGSFNIETNFPLTDIAHLKIVNLIGATVYETQNVVSNTVQLPRPTAGTFFVVMILKDGAVLTQKMIVKR